MNFNQQIKEKETLLNYEGERAFAMSTEMELYSAVVTTMLNDSFYENGEDRMERIADLVSRTDPRFTAQLAIYARTVMNLRSVPLLLITELARIHNGDNLVSRTIGKTLSRADEIAELLACYQLRNPKTTDKRLNKLSQQIKLGLQIAFNRFDEYQFAKYDRSSQWVKLRDALFLVHPKAKDEAQQAIFDKIASKSLKTPYTWETELSELGKKSFDTPEEKRKAFAAKWEELIDSNKVGYMALLRNLRNFLKYHISQRHIETVCQRLADEKSVLESKQLPFRFLSAFREVIDGYDVENYDDDAVGMILDSLESAVKVSAANIRGFDPDTRLLLACDVSGSMLCSPSGKSTIEVFDIGLLLAMLFKTTSKNAIIGIFGDCWKTLRPTGDRILAQTQAMRDREGEVGYSTNGYTVIEWLRGRQKIVDKVLMFTDCQMWDSTFGDKRIRNEWIMYKAIAPDAKLYLFDLCGYGDSPFRKEELDVHIISGWSEKMFDMLYAIEHGEDGLAEIKKIEI